MAYIPDPRDTSAPIDDEIAATAAAEFRALKTFLMTLVLAEHELALDASTTSFDTFQNPGLYRVTGATALVGGNAPPGATSGTGSLIVVHNSVGSIQLFVCTAVSTPLMQVRFFSSPSTWSSWTPIGSGSAADVVGALGYTPANITGANATVDSNWPILAKGVHLNTSNGFGTRTVSTSGPSGGVDGDIWMQVP